MSQHELLVDTNKETKSLIVTPELQASLPNIVPAFETVDQRYFENPLKYLSHIENSLFLVDGHEGTGAKVACSLLYDDRSKLDEILVIFAPFSDVAPKTSAQRMFDYTKIAAPNFVDIQKAQPNSWSQATKSKTVFELMAALGHGIPVLTIFSPISPRSYSLRERVSIMGGDFLPATRLMERAIAQAQSEIHGISSETQIDKIHTQGGSLGASNAIGASAAATEKQVLTVTAQELIMGPNLLQIADRFVIRPTTGEVSNKPEPKGSVRVLEPALRRAIDAHGNELAMFPRMINAMTKIGYLIGLSFPRKTRENIELLISSGVAVTTALAENSSLTQQTPSQLPEGVDLYKIKAIEGQKIAHLANEHVGVSATVTALGISKARQNGKKS